MTLPKKQKPISQFFSAFLKLTQSFEHFETKLPYKLMYFRNYGLRKTCLDKCLKCPISKDASTSNMVNGSEHP